METLFTFLFKYEPFVFDRGQLTFQWSLDAWVTTLILLILAIFLFLVHRRSFPRSQGLDGWILLTLRSSFFFLLFLLAMRPSLIIPQLVPKENLLAILVDNSRSMGIDANNKKPRGVHVQELVEKDSDFLKDLDEKFSLRLFQFDSKVSEPNRSLELDWLGDQTNIVLGLKEVLASTKNMPLAGILLFSDGSDNSYRDLQEVLSELKTRQIPVHTIGMGPESPTRDIEITQVSAPRVLIPETISEVRVTFRHHGFGGSLGHLEVRESNSLIMTQEIHFPRDSNTLTTTVKIAPKSAGIKSYHFTLQPLVGEEIQKNNSRTAIVQVRNLPARILYVEGHPRWEYKFIRRALVGDDHLRLVTLLRTALNKFYRQGIEEETTLATGFPSKRDELFNYQGVLFGNVESSFFSYQQMEMVRDFVGQRGGGFLMLGGSSAFAAGKYQNTPIEEILPVWLYEEEDRPRSLYIQEESKIQLTNQGLRHPAFQLSGEDAQNLSQWDSIPALLDWNVVKGIKSGATILARLNTSMGNTPENDNPPLFVSQRYGRGHTLAMLTGSSWQWQMLRDHEDQTHEIFWRQIMRWLVSSARDHITIETDREVYSQNEPVHLRAEIRDKSFSLINDAQVEASITSPGGEVEAVALQWDAHEDGVYRAQWTTHEDGLHTVGLTAKTKTQENIKTFETDTAFLTSTGSQEYFEAFQKKDFLEKLALETGGSYYTVSETDQIPEQIMYTKSHTSVIKILDIWDMPFNLFVMISLLSAEWILRRRYGLI
ncbi:MAG: glutamine amidotransferase [Acidobacteriota bacterium]|nr:glutamine amidotransferase [Acidobacteriota bacterium]